MSSRIVGFEEVWDEIRARVDSAFGRRGLQQHDRDDLMQELSYLCWGTLQSRPFNGPRHAVGYFVRRGICSMLDMFRRNHARDIAARGLFDATPVHESPHASLPERLDLADLMEDPMLRHVANGLSAAEVAETCGIHRQAARRLMNRSLWRARLHTGAVVATEDGDMLRFDYRDGGTIGRISLAGGSTISPNEDNREALMSLVDAYRGRGVRPRPRVENPRPDGSSGPCECGCGGMTKSRFCPGHNARRVSCRT